jgi:multiple sugar transport system ATP-binding protein
VFLLDEPLSNLDALLRERVRAELKELFENQNVPVVYVTHDQTEAMTLSSKVAVLNQGLVQQLDPPHKIYNQPANLFVAGFVGSQQMNLLTLSCEGRNAVLGNPRIPLPASLTTVPRQIVMGIRPEHVQLAESADGQHTIQGKVFLVENLGMHNLISLRVQGTETNPITLRALLPPNNNWQNQILNLILPPDHLHWFDTETGDAIFRDARERLAVR